MSGFDIADMVQQAWEEIVLPVIKELEDGKAVDRDHVLCTGSDRSVPHFVSSDSMAGRTTP